MFPRNQRGRFLPRRGVNAEEPVELPVLTPMPMPMPTPTPVLTPNNLRNNNTKNNKPSPLLDVREEKQIPELRQLIFSSPTTYILIHADWCGHCHRYMPKFKDIAKTPGRVANMAAVHHEIVEKVPELKNAKITGYPSVVKVEPTGKVEDYKVPGSPETTNVVPQMNDPKVMKELVKAVETAQPNAKIPGPQGTLLSNTNFVKKNAQVTAQAGGSHGSVLGAFMGALNKVGPAALLLLGSSMLPKQTRGKTYKSPKKANRRASTRRNKHR